MRIPGQAGKTRLSWFRAGVAVSCRIRGIALLCLANQARLLTYYSARYVLGSKIPVDFDG